MENKELTAKEALEIIGEICESHPHCSNCPLLRIRNNANCHQSLASNADAAIKICKQWEEDHTPIETEWAYICRIIQDDNGVKKCVYEEDITESEDALPFGGEEFAAEHVLKEYCKNHKGKFFATVERVCRVKGK